MDQRNLWNTVRRISGGFPSKNNLVLLNDTNMANSFMNFNFPEIVTDLEFTPTTTDEKIIITYAEVLQLINSKKDHSSPGIDEISFYMLKNINPLLLSKIVELLNIVVNSGEIPDDWRDIKIIPILKHLKNPNNINSYRPLAMLCVILKIINFVIKRHLNYFLEQNNIIPDYSFGFKKKTSAINCVNTLISHVHNAKRNKKVVIATFLDLSKAFDNVDIKILLKKLSELKVPTAIVNWIYYYLKKRNTKLILNDGTVLTTTTNKGLPQGCPLSPILFNIYTTELHSLAEDDKILFQFADDFTVMIIADNLQLATEKMNLFLSKIAEKLNNLGMIINSDKCATIIFTNKFHPNTNISINNNPIEVKAFHKFLGIQIDHKLNYKTHIDATVVKAKKKINILKMVGKRKNGAHPETMLKVAKAIVQPHLDYGLSIIAKASKTVFAKLETIQHLYIRTCMRFLRSTPNHVILAESGILPLKERAEYLTLKEIIKTLYYQNSPLTKFIKSFITSEDLPTQCSYLERIASINNYHLIQLGSKIPFKTNNKIKGFYRDR